MNGYQGADSKKGLGQLAVQIKEILIINQKVQLVHPHNLKTIGQAIPVKEYRSE